MKYLVVLINTLIIVICAYLCAGITYRLVIPERFILPSIGISFPAGSETDSCNRSEKTENKSSYRVIVQRNLFHVETRESEQKKAMPEKLDSSATNLVLWGTITGNSHEFAVIENKKDQKQNLYEPGDLVDNARIKKILRQSVILDFQGRKKILEMNKDFHEFKSPEPADRQKTAFRPEQQITLRAHVSEGRKSGLVVCGIRPGTVFRQMGLKNGDIIREINGIPLNSPADIPEFFNIVKNTDNAVITLSRRKKEKQLFFRLHNGRVLNVQGD